MSAPDYYEDSGASEEYGDNGDMQKRAGELDRFARLQLKKLNILEAFQLFEKSRPPFIRLPVPHKALRLGVHRVPHLLRYDCYRHQRYRTRLHPRRQK
jgi:hypothetical protein